MCGHGTKGTLPIMIMMMIMINITAAGAVDREFDIYLALGPGPGLGPGPWDRPVTLGPGPKGLAPGPWAQALGRALALQIHDFPALGPSKNIDFP